MTRGCFLFMTMGIFTAGWFGCAALSENACKRDRDCQPYERCNTITFRCVCERDEACAQEEFCNVSGSCQRKEGCFSNKDCEQGRGICDSASGACLDPNKCTEDVQCDIGQICSGSCIAGCRDTTDCDLSKLDVCIDGICQGGLCETNRYCPIGQVCQKEPRTCVAAPEIYCKPGCSPICEGCEDRAKGPCDDPKNICFDGGESGTACWVACESVEDCPSGYSCLPTAVGWIVSCEEDADCSAVTNACGNQSHRCAISQQPCQVQQDCYPLQARCMLNSCVFGSHCRPAGGC
jgi:hypothetical protein